MEPDAPLHSALQALERALEVRLTLIDHRGVFRDPRGRPLLSEKRQSHRAHAFCAATFGPACVEHCRHTANARAQADPTPWCTRCWRGVREVAVPLRREGAHLGILYAGLFRDDADPPDLPHRLRPLWQALPPFDAERAARLAGALPLAAAGLIASLDEHLALDAPSDRRRRIETFLRYRSAEPVRLEDLAEALALSPSRTGHVVRELYGRPFRTLLTEERVRAAQAMLSATDLPVAEVGRSVGFDDPCRFSKVFRRATGRSPRAWRHDTGAAPATG